MVPDIQLRLLDLGFPTFNIIYCTSGSQRVDTAFSQKSFVFGGLYQNLTGRVWYVYAVTLDPLIYVTWYTRHLPKPTGVRYSGSFRYTRSRDYQTPTRHAPLGSGRC